MQFYSVLHPDYFPSAFYQSAMLTMFMKKKRLEIRFRYIRKLKGKSMMQFYSVLHPDYFPITFNQSAI